MVSASIVAVSGGVPETILSKESQKPTPNTVEVTSHEAEVLSAQFSPSGRTLATASADKTIRLTSVYGQNEELLVLKKHKDAVLQVQWTPDGDRIFSCSADRTAAVWDLATGQRAKKLGGHTDIVNSCSCARKDQPNILVTGSDDRSVKLWDLRVNRAVVHFAERYQVLSVAYDSTYRIFSGSLDSQIRVYDVRAAVTCPISASAAAVAPKQAPPSLMFSLTGHINAITGIALSSDNSRIVSNSMDQTVRLWDVRPFTSRNEDRCFGVIRGPTHNFEQTLHRVNWSPDDLSISAGSADRTAYIYSIEGVESEQAQPKLLYRLPGHSGAVTEVAFHPQERIVATTGTDKRTFIKKLN